MIYAKHYRKICFPLVWKLTAGVWGLIYDLVIVVWGQQQKKNKETTCIQLKRRRKQRSLDKFDKTKSYSTQKSLFLPDRS